MLRVHCTQSLQCSFLLLFFFPGPPPPTTIIIPCHVFTKTLGALPFVECFALRAADGSSWNHENVLSNKGFLNPNQKKSGDLSLLGASVRNTPHTLLALSRRRLQAVSVCSPALWLWWALNINWILLYLLWSRFGLFFFLLPNSVLLIASVLAPSNKSTGTQDVHVKHSHRWLQLQNLHFLMSCMCVLRVACMRTHRLFISHTHFDLVIGEYICPMKFCLLLLDSPLLQHRSSKEQMGFSCAPCPLALSSIPPLWSQNVPCGNEACSPQIQDTFIPEQFCLFKRKRAS